MIYFIFICSSFNNYISSSFLPLISFVIVVGHSSSLMLIHCYVVVDFFNGVPKFVTSNRPHLRYYLDIERDRSSTFSPFSTQITRTYVCDSVRGRACLELFARPFFSCFSIFLSPRVSIIVSSQSYGSRSRSPIWRGNDWNNH